MCIKCCKWHGKMKLPEFEFGMGREIFGRDSSAGNEYSVTALLFVAFTRRPRRSMCSGHT